MVWNNNSLMGKAHVVHMREAVGWTAVWITLALLFNAGIASFWSAQAGVEFLTGYLVDKSLSMDMETTISVNACCRLISPR